MLDIEVLRKDALTWEKKYSHMYLDSTDHVTVGIGHMIPNVESAKRLSFVFKTHQIAGGVAIPAERNGQKATPAEIEADFKRVTAHPQAGKKPKDMLRASAFAKFTLLELPDPSINELLDGDIKVHWDELQEKLPLLETYPQPAQLALFDMYFNMRRNLWKFGELRKAVDSKDWAKAAKECWRGDVGKDRNDATVKLFERAALETPKKAAPQKGANVLRPRHDTLPICNLKKTVTAGSTPAVLIRPRVQRGK